MVELLLVNFNKIQIGCLLSVGSQHTSKDTNNTQMIDIPLRISACMTRKPIICLKCMKVSFCASCQSEQKFSQFGTDFVNNKHKRITETTKNKLKTTKLSQSYSKTFRKTTHNTRNVNAKHTTLKINLFNK